MLTVLRKYFLYAINKAILLDFTQKMLPPCQKYTISLIKNLASINFTTTMHKWFCKKNKCTDKSIEVA